MQLQAALALLDQPLACAALPFQDSAD